MRRRSIDELLDESRDLLTRVAPSDLADEMAQGALVVDVRPSEQRAGGRILPGALVIDRSVLEWRLDPASPDRIPESSDYDRRIIIVCEEGYSSSLAAATLIQLGLQRATDLIGGYQAWQAWRAYMQELAPVGVSARTSAPRRRHTSRSMQTLE